jgi:PRTRC genetic system protein E
MFTTLHALAKQATLMITIAAEGDGQLRVNVTPMPFDTKAKSNLPQPLSLLATPEEFDADFITALSTWQAPKRSLIQQAQEAAGGTSTAAAPALPAPKPAAKAEKTDKTEKGARKTRAGKGGAEQEPVEQPDADAASGDAQPDAALQEAGGDAQVVNDAAGAAAEPVEQQAVAALADGVDPEAVDKFTLDLF